MRIIFVIVLLIDLFMAGYLFGSYPTTQDSTVSGIHNGAIIESQIDSSQPIERDRIIEIKRIYSLAQDKLNELVVTGYWDHANSNGCDFHCRVEGYTWNGGIYSWVGENLYRGKCDIGYVYKLWKLSPIHNAILKHDYDEEVILRATYGENGCYYILIRGVLK